MRPVIVASAIVALAVLAVGCGGGQKVGTVTVTASGPSSSGVNAPPSNTAPTPITTDASGDKLMAEVKLRVPVTDDGVQFRVRSAKTVTSIRQPFGSPVVPLAGARLVVVKLTAKNLGAGAVQPFCGDTGAVLADPAHRNWQYDATQTIDIEELNSGVCDAIQPGLAMPISLVFDVPKTANITFIALWNGDPSGPDPQGMTYVGVDLP